MNKTIMQVIPSLCVGGAEVMAANLSIELKKAGYNVVVISFIDEQTSITRRLSDNGIEVIYLGKSSGFSVKVIISLRKLIKKYKPAVIHTHLFSLEYLYLADLFIKNRIIHTVHNVAKMEVNEFRQKLRKKLFRNRKITPVSISEIVQASLSKLYDMKSDDFPMIYNGIPLEKCVIKQEYDFHEPISIIAIGRIVEQKNHLNLLKAIDSINKEGKYSLRLSILGDGSLKQELVDYTKITNSENSLNLMGIKDLVYNDLSEADIFCLTSKWEGMPITLIEAMQSGVPVIASNVGGIPDMITDGFSGILCDYDISSIKNALIKMILTKSDERELMAHNAQLRAKDFSSVSMCNNYLKLYFE